MDSTRVSYFRNFIFGVEDSLVSTVGLLSGVAIAGMAREDIFVTGVVLIFVEAISMSAGSFLSESSAEELVSGKDEPTKKSYGSAIVMFVSYFVSGFFPLLPYVVLPTEVALWVSIAVSIAVLFILGFVGAKLSKTSLVKNGLRMVLVGGLAIVVGAVVGYWIG